MNWETVIGLEVHVELSTKTKIFCSCTTKFGGEPNTHCCPVCTGMPGTLPVLNGTVVDYAVRAGLALGCEINRRCKFDRKNYVYPDLPKAYQISQLYLPICHDGGVEIRTESGTKEIRIREIHMEEDAGKLIHDAWAEATKVDYNRGGVPLIEIVSQPDFRGADEVVEYLERLKSTLEYLGVSDCKMQEGSMRADINLSVRPAGSQELGTRTEMKNMNSLKAIARAIHYESKRQIELIGEGGRVVQETRRWDDNKDASYAMRTKENAQDYRYFPDPDLPPLELSDKWLEERRRSLPEMAPQKKARYMADYGLPEYDADMLTDRRALAEFFESAVSLGCPPKEISNWMMGHTLRLLKEKNLEASDLTMTPQTLCGIIRAVERGAINRNTAVTVFEALFDTNGDVDAYIRAHGLEQVGDRALITDAISRVLGENLKSVEEYRSGKTKVFGFLVGQVMRELKGRADPGIVNSALKEMLDGGQ